MVKFSKRNCGMLAATTCLSEVGSQILTLLRLMYYCSLGSPTKFTNKVLRTFSSKGHWQSHRTGFANRYAYSHRNKGMVREIMHPDKL